MRNRKKLITNIFKIIFFPLYLLLVVYKFIIKKIKSSIRLKLSWIYIRKLLGAMILTCLTVIIVYGSIKIYKVVSLDHKSISNILLEPGINYSRLQKYSKEHNSHIIIYDRDKNFLYGTKNEFSTKKYKNLPDIVKTEHGLLFALNRSVSVKDMYIVIYTDIKNQVSEIMLLSKITFYVFSTIIFFSIISILISVKGIFLPLKEMTETVKGISKNNLNLRLNVGGSKNELKELAITFNDMMNRIEEDYNKQKQFVSDASHELRTPIAVIHGYVDMLNRWGKNEREVLEESINAIKNESENMNDLVEKLLFLARNDKGTLLLQKDEFSLTEMLIETVKETQIIDSSHRIEYDIKKEISVLADRKRIKQAVRIFMDNALKYTPRKGKITVTLGSENRHASINIRDTGIGMKKDELQHIFDRFYRSDKSRTKEKGGHGLGLAIGKIIVLGHNGKIKVRSKPGEGSEFIILLPR